jgi:hypothetical protein
VTVGEKQISQLLRRASESFHALTKHVKANDQVVAQVKRRAESKA